MDNGTIPKIKNCYIAAGLYIAALVLITAITWPWVLHFDGELLYHWDPPFHAWKLEFMARRILAGDPLFFNRETTLLYPNTGTLYFEALQYPAALFGALLFATTNFSSECIYHLTMLAFWGLSAPFMFLFLRSLKLSTIAAASSALAFCILPYRISYINEFQMQFAFVTPIVFAAILNFMRNPTFLRGVLVSAALWFYAITELNQAVFILFTLPFIAVSFFTVKAELIMSRNFWQGIAGAAIAGGLLVFVLLLPYAIQHDGGAVIRELSEVDRHSVQVFSFLRPFGKFRLWSFNAKVEEWQAYPTIALAICSLIWILRMISKSLRDESRPSLRRIAPAAAFFATVVFVIITSLFQCGIGLSNNLLTSVWSGLPLLCAFLAICACTSAGSDKPEFRMTLALCCSALFMAFLTNGPILSITVRNRPFAAANFLYIALYKYCPLLKGFRAACRFGVFVHFAMLVTSAFVIDAAIHRTKERFSARPILSMFARCAIGAVFLGAVAIESIPQESVLRTMSADSLESFPVIKHLTKRTKPFTLAVFPIGHRLYDGMTMFSILKNRFNSFYAWCGYVPPETQAVCDAARHGDYATVCSELSTLWPECLILVDRAKPIPANQQYAEAFPSHVMRLCNGYIVDYAAALANEAEIISSDGRFDLLALKTRKRSKKFIKKFRTDYASQNQTAIFQFDQITSPVEAKVIFNGETIEELHKFSNSELVLPLPTDKIAKTGCNTIEIELDKEVLLKNFRLGRQ